MASKEIGAASPRQVGAGELGLLFELGQRLDRGRELDAAIRPVLQSMDANLGLSRGTLTLQDPETGHLAVEAGHRQGGGRWREGEGLPGAVLQAGLPAVQVGGRDEPVLLDGAADDPLQVRRICVPIRLDGAVIGTLGADNHGASRNAWDKNVRLLATIASMIAQAVRQRRAAAQEQARLQAENTRLHQALKERFRPANIVGTSKAMQAVFELIERVSGSNATVLILGESGVGKELVAQAIHYHSPRADGPLIKVNCAALPSTLLESELFGHEAGAFTGAATQRKGRFELAHRGTIFLDEIGAIPSAAQLALLRVLQERELERVGGAATVAVDVRVIAATNSDLARQVEQGGFRQDLYYRLNVVPIRVPPLRERRTDIPLLADFFVERYGSTSGRTVKRLSTPAIDMLTRYHWPGNVRELENCIERAVLLSDDGVIHGRHLPPTLQTGEATGTGPTGTLQEALDRVERELLVDALKECRGNMAAAARVLGLTERKIGLRVRKHGIRPERYKAE